MLFHNIEDFVDYATIGVFIASKTQSENPILAIFTDVYVALNLWYEMKRKKDYMFSICVLHLAFISCSEKRHRCSVSC